MPYNSVNTNVGAMIALQNLNATNSELAMAQTRINTGKKVSSAKDNGAIWAIAQNQRATSGSLNAVRDSLQRSQSTIDVAIAAGETVSDLLLQMKEKALASSDTSLDSASRNALNEDFKALRDQVGKAVQNATFNGVNMLNGASATSIAALADADGTSKLTVQAQAHRDGQRRTVLGQAMAGDPVDNPEGQLGAHARESGLAVAGGMRGQGGS